MFDDANFPPPLPPFRHWLRHMAAVPKGFLRYQVLELLNEKPMSGSEIMNEIEKRTNGCWKPSPGSVYPLLAWLQDNGYIREVPTEEAGVKRYTLTDKGKQLLEEQRKMRGHFRMGRKLFVPPLIGSFLLRLPMEQTEEVREAFRRLFKAFLSLGLTLEERFSEQALKETLQVLNETAQRLEGIEKKLRGEKA
ncbi:MAG: PadR family transcriptional regulator [Candidatus Bathyarchaeia archaeon]